MTQPPPPPGSQPVDPPAGPPPSGPPPSGPPPSGPPPSGPPPSGPPPSGPPPSGPPSSAPAGTGSAGLGTVDVRAIATRVLTGNWIGSGVVAALTLATAGLLSLVLGLIAKPPDFGIDNSLTFGAVILAGAFGADFFVRGEPEDFGGETWEYSLSVAAFPLTITIISLAVAVIAFRRMVRDYPSPLPAIGDAVRIALFVALPLLVVSLVFRSDFDELGRGWFADAARGLDFGGESTWGATAPGAFFIPLCLVFLVLGLACVARREWWSGWARTVAEWAAPPLHGLATLTILLPVTGLIGVGLLMFGGDRVDEDVDTGDTAAAWAAIAAFLANGGFALLALGSGAEVGTASEEVGEGEEDSSTDWHRVGWYAGDRGDEPALWAAPVVLLAVLVAAAWVVARVSDRAHLLRNLLCWVGSLLVFLPIMARLANGHGVFELEAGSEEYESSGVMGVEGLQTTFFITGIALLVAVGVALARGGINKESLAAFKGFQTNAGRSTGSAAPTAPPPGMPPAQPPTAMPPAQPPTAMPPAEPPTTQELPKTPPPPPS
ncbi:hypothetical protein SFC88_08770 [Nocardioides sp. HM23]|uniref:hypothetical protein n=1 Tax=Nocardioides bizhenqiangii TaxID=3095076 RepID=UPI002ACA8928|nr:hypothetical protein [Nocardioides sp. HM23]MDZ5620916.1 hypothetical protein [Nocardioides sp. HM23]